MSGNGAAGSRNGRAAARSVLALVFVVSVTMSLASSMLNIALPDVAADLGASAGEATWILAGYQLSNVGLIIWLGQLSDVRDRGRLFLGAVALFTVASALLAVAGSATTIIVLRVVQGAAAAALLANSAALVAALFTGPALRRAMGVYLAGFSVAQVAGPGLGGVVTDRLGWRALFAGLVPLCALAWVWGRFALARVTLPPPRPRRLDIVGHTLLVAALSALLTGLTLVADHGWGSAAALVPLGVAALLVPLVGRSLTRSDHPVIDPELLRDPGFRWGMSAGFLVAMPRLALMVLASLYLQGIGGQSPLQAAVRVTVLAVGLTLGALLADRLAAASGERRTSVLAAVAALLGTVALVGLVGAHPVAGPFDAALLVVGLGTGAFQTLNIAQLLRIGSVARAGSVNATRVMLQSLSMAVATSTTVSLAVTWASPAAARAFVAGHPELLSEADVDALLLGIRAVLVVFALVVLAGLGATLRTPRPTAAPATAGGTGRAGTGPAGVPGDGTDRVPRPESAT